MRLFHFSEDPNIEVFRPRPVLSPSVRPAGREWLNGPLVWAIAEDRQGMYLFPRECPRILLWATPATTAADRRRWLDDQPGMLAYAEENWRERIAATRLYRYEFDAAEFEDLDDAGMWVARTPQTVLARQTLHNLPECLRVCGVQLRFVDSLLPWKQVWQSTVHASGIRLRNAQHWYDVDS